MQRNDQSYHDDSKNDPESQVLLFCASAPEREKVSVVATDEKLGNLSVGEYHVHIRTCNLKKSVLETYPKPLQSSALTAQLGFPLQAVPALTTEHSTTNWGIDNLFAVSDTESPNFFVNLITFWGDALIVRSDGKTMTPAQINALEYYVTGMREDWSFRIRHM